MPDRKEFLHSPTAASNLIGHYRADRAVRGAGVEENHWPVAEARWWGHDPVVEECVDDAVHLALQKRLHLPLLQFWITAGVQEHQ